MAHAVRVVSRPSLSNVDRVLRSQAGTEALLCSQYLVRKEICKCGVWRLLRQPGTRVGSTSF